MSSDDHVYKSVEIVGSSTTGVDEAVRAAVQRAGKTLRNLEWFEVLTVRGHIEDGEIAHYQVALKLGFRLE